MWIKIKDKLKKWWKQTLLFIGIGAVIVLAAGTEPDIPVNLQLKADRADILESYSRIHYKTEIKEYKKEMKKGKEIDVPVYENIPDYEYIEYAYKGNKKNEKVDDKEILEERTNVIVTRDEGIDENGNKKKSQESGHAFYKENDEWFEVGFATTTPEVFNKKTAFEIIKSVLALDTGWKSPAANTAGARTNTPANGYASDDAYADMWSDTGGTSYIEYQTFGFGVTAGATINGIELSAEGKWHADGSGSTLVYVYSSSAASYSTLVTVDWTAIEATVVKGNSTDLWGKTWVAGDFSDANFKAKIYNSDSDYNTYLDHIQVKVYYTEAPPVIPVLESGFWVE